MFAARATLRSLVCGPQVLTMIGFTSWVCHGSGELWQKALAASGRRAVMRTAATSAGAVTRGEWRLDFRALSGKTARTVIRDGREQSLAVHSVKS